jgi:predicted transposase/invertase (TIGR01784 family)
MSPTIPLRTDIRRPYTALPFDPSLFSLHDGDGGDGGDPADARPDAPEAPPPLPAASPGPPPTEAQLAALKLRPRPGAKPRYLRITNDAVFKLLFAQPGQEAFVGFVLETLGVVEAPANVVRLGTTEMPGRPDEKRGIVDVQVDHADGSETLIELQNKRENGYHARVVFYLVRRHGRSPEPGEPYENAKPTRVLTILGHEEFPGDARVIRRFMLADTETRDIYDERLAVTVCELTKHRRQMKRAAGRSPESSPLRKALLDFLSAEDEATFEAAAAQHPILMSTAQHLARISEDPRVALNAHMAACDAATERRAREREEAERAQLKARAEAAEANAQAIEAQAKADLEAEKAKALAATRAIAKGLLADGMAREKVEALVATPLADLGL